MPSSLVTRELYYSPQQMFDLVADVEQYPQFVPNWVMVRVRHRPDGSGYHTDQVVRYGPVRHSFGSDTSLRPPHQIEVYSNDSLFRHMTLLWDFHLAEDQGCRITLSVDFELRSRALQALGAILSRDSVTKMVDAFEERAKQVYGPPAARSHD